MIALRSTIFNIVFYVHMITVLVVATPVYFFLPQRWCMAIVASWARRTLWLLRIICGTKVEFRGRENIPKDGRYILAAKHQSIWETFALLAVEPNPGVVIKRELLYVPVWGWWAWKARMVYVTRGGTSAALREIVDGSGKVLAAGRPVLIFPEGTRRPPGASPEYKYGIAHLYKELRLPVVPVALNSGIYWPRRRFMRFPGTIVVTFLPAIESGLKTRAFLHRVTSEVESECDRLLMEADIADPRPPFGPEATERLAELRFEQRPIT
ncbi:MAG: lysophospholipid acyltransferase family protein [Alphaproteobacteria bacterium]